MKARDAMIAWSPARSGRRSETAGMVEVGPWPDGSGWSKRYGLTGGACYAAWRDCSDLERVAMLFVTFHSMVVRDGIEPQVAHKAFLVIDEYRERIAPDA